MTSALFSYSGLDFKEPATRSQTVCVVLAPSSKPIVQVFAGGTKPSTVYSHSLQLKSLAFGRHPQAIQCSQQTLLADLPSSDLTTGLCIAIPSGRASPKASVFDCHSVNRSTAAAKKLPDTRQSQRVAHSGLDLRRTLRQIAWQLPQTHHFSAK